MVQMKSLKRGDPLMKEGESSNSMYWVQTGTLRLFKKKGSGFIELGVIHSGEVVGDMSFLDNLPRSASVEALQPCEVVEIPRGKFDEYINAQPSWMKSLIYTLVKRLRTTNNRLRELESSSTVYAKDEEGRTMKVHEFLSTSEVLRLSTALLLVSTRNGEKQPDGSVKVKAGWVQLYGAQIFNLHLSKIQVFIDTMSEAQVLRIDKQKDHVDLYVKSPEFVEKFIFWLNEENLKETDKQLPITNRGMAILDAIAEFGDFSGANPESEAHLISMDSVFQKAAEKRNVKIPFEMSSFDELVKCGFSQEVRLDGTTKTANVNFKRFSKLYPYLSLRYRFKAINETKRP